MKKISIMTPCYNEEGNIENAYLKIKEVFDAIEDCEYEHIFADNASTDRTTEILRDIASKDKKVKVILNNRNFGPDRSATNALLNCYGDAVVSIACDLQDPPELIPIFIKEWKNGFKMVLGEKESTKDGFILSKFRRMYYYLMDKLSEDGHLRNVTGYGLYDKEIIDIVRSMDDPLPYMRGIIADLGFSAKLIPYAKRARDSGKSSYNFLSYLDFAIFGMTNTSRKPLRIATIIGVIFSVIFFIISLVYLILKLFYWNDFQMGLAPIMIGLFFIGSIQLAFIGLLGEYIGVILLKVTKRPIVVEKERINFGKVEDEKETN